MVPINEPIESFSELVNFYIMTSIWVRFSPIKTFSWRHLSTFILVHTFHKLTSAVSVFYVLAIPEN